MVKIVKEAGKKIYECEICCLHYMEKKFAERCEAWCKKNRSCNLAITCYAIKHAGKVT